MRLDQNVLRLMLKMTRDVTCDLRIFFLIINYLISLTNIRKDIKKKRKSHGI